MKNTFRKTYKFASFTSAAITLLLTIVIGVFLYLSNIFNLSILLGFAIICFLICFVIIQYFFEFWGCARHLLALAAWPKKKNEEQISEPLVQVCAWGVRLDWLLGQSGIHFLIWGMRAHLLLDVLAIRTSDRNENIAYQNSTARQACACAAHRECIEGGRVRCAS